MFIHAAQNRIHSRPDKDGKHNAGATLLEVLTVVFIVGIISAVVIGRSDMGNADLLAQAEAIKAHIRYAQSRSMDSSRRWGVRVAASGQTYWMFVDGEGNRRRLPGETSDTVNLADNGLTLTPMRLSFNDRGQPCSDDNGTLLLTSHLDLSLSAGAEFTTIRIVPNTGFVP